MNIPIMFPELNAVQLKMLYRVIEDIIGADDEGKKVIDIGSEFANPRDYRRQGKNSLRDEQRERLNNLKGE